MSKHVRKILPLLLCLLLMACLLPAAYADGVEVSTFDDLQSAINSGAASCTFTGQVGGPNQGLTLNIPAGFTLNIPSGFLCLDDLTVNGTVNVTDDGMLIVNKSLTGSGAVNVAAGCLLNLPAACYDSESHELVSLIHNSSDNVTLVHTPADQAELRSATDKAQDAAGHDFKNGFLFLQDLTISNGAIMFFNGEMLSVQNNATLTISDDAVIVSDETIMVENGNIRVSNGGRLVSNVELRPGTADFTGDGYFGGETIAVTNTVNPDSCVTGLDMSQFWRKEKSDYVIFGHISEASEIMALRDAIADPNVSGFTLAGEEPVVLTRDLIVPKGFELTVEGQLVIASGAQLMMNGFNSRAVVTGDITIAEGGSLLSMGKINLAETGTLHVSGTFTGTPGSSVEVLDADLANIQRRVIVDHDSGEFNGMGGVAISKTLLEDYSSGGVDCSKIIDVPDMGAWSEIEAEDAVCYFPGKDIDPDIFPSMCESGRFSQIRLRGTGDLSLTDNLTIPEGFYLKVRTGSRLIVPEGKTLTINGKIEASYSGRIDVAGELINNNEIEMGDDGVIDVTGAFANNGPVNFWLERPDSANTPQLVIEPSATYTAGGGFRFDAPVNPDEAVQGIVLSDYCRAIDHKSPSRLVLFPGSTLTFELMFPEGEKYIDYLEVHGVPTLELSSNVEIPVFDDGTVSKVDMHATRLVVPAGKSVLVNGELAVNELVIESGGSVTVNGYLDAVNGITLNNGGALTVNNTHIDAGYVPTTDIEALKDIVYNGDADLLLHRVVWPSDNVSNAIRTASNAVDDHVNCMVELRTDWTVAEAFDAHLITLRVRKGSTLTVNNVLTVKDLVVDDGGNVVTGDGGSITYAAEDTELEVGSLSQLQASISAFNQQREQDPTARIEVYTSGDFTITEDVTIPEGFQLGCGNDLTIAANAVVTVNGKLDACNDGYIDILGRVINYGQVRMFDNGVIHAGGTLENRSQICYENVTSDVKHLVVDEKENLQIWGPFCVYDGVSPTESVLGFPVDNWCISVPKDEPEVSLYMILDGVNVEDNSSSGRYSYIEIRGTEAYTLKKDMTVPAGTEVVMNSIVLTVPNGKSLTVNGELAVKELVVENGGELLLHENGTVAVSGKFTNNGTIGMGENAQIAVSGEFVNNRLIYLRSWNGTRPLIAIEAQGKYEEHGGFDVLTQFEYERAISAIDLSDYCRLVYVTSDNNRITRLFPGRDLSFDPNGFKQMCENGDTVYLEIRGRETFQMDSDVTIPNVMEVVANGVELVIPAGVTVTVNGKLTTRSDAKPGVSGSAQVMGVLINNGSIDLMGATDLALVNGGVYSGGGTVTRGGEPYTIWNDPANADIRLPAGLKTLESQALANGDFFSVYIPAGTTTIVSDAFGNKAGMIIYGVPGSEAETFAGNNNYLFAPVAPAA